MAPPANDGPNSSGPAKSGSTDDLPTGELVHGNGPVGNGGVGDGPVGNGAVGNGAVGNGAVGNGAVGDGPVDDGVVGDGSSARFVALRDEALGCTKCGLCEGRTQVVFGMGDRQADLMFVGEAPGAQEDQQGLPFVGRSGKLLDRLMAEEMDLTRDSAYIVNVVKCRPPENRDPLPAEIAACRPYLDAQLELIDPKVVVTLGNFATRALLDTKIGITKLRGQAYSWGSRVLVPTLHPAAVLRGGGDAMAKVRADLVRAKAATRGGLVDLTDSEVVAR